MPLGLGGATGQHLHGSGDEGRALRGPEGGNGDTSQDGTEASGERVGGTGKGGQRQSWRFLSHRAVWRRKAERGRSRGQSAGCSSASCAVHLILPPRLSPGCLAAVETGMEEGKKSAADDKLRFRWAREGPQWLSCYLGKLREETELTVASQGEEARGCSPG